VDVPYCWTVVSENALSSFINYGMSVLKPGRTESVYQRTVDGVSVNVCAELCLNETTFYCLSFDMVFTSAPAAGAGSAVSDVGQCRLSQHDAATADGLVIDTVNPQHNHYERIGQSVSVSALSRVPPTCCPQLLKLGTCEPSFRSDSIRFESDGP